MKELSALRRRARMLIIAGLLVMVAAVFDPLEGSVIVVLGAGMIAAGARLRSSRHLVYLYSLIGGVRALGEARGVA